MRRRRRSSISLDRDEDQLTLSVADDGRGLPEGFEQEHAGLGLSIVLSLITGDLHGSCDVQGPPGGGTTVRVTVPDPH